MLKSTIKLILLVLVISLTSSCRKDRIADITPANPEMKSIEVTDQFDWKTMKDIQVLLEGPVTSLVEIIGQEGTVYHKAYLIQNQLYDVKLAIPVFEKKLTILYYGKSVAIDVDKTQLNYKFTF